MERMRIDMGVRRIGILFKAPLVRAIRDGRKVATRRIGPGEYCEGDSWGHRGSGAWERMRRVGKWTESEVVQCRYGDVGSRLWVRETWACPGDGSVVYRADHGDKFDLYDIHPGFRAMNPELSWKWKSSMFMPYWACRLELELTSVSVERLQDITEEQAVAEGMHQFGDTGLWGSDPLGTPASLIGGSAREAFALYWEHINGDGSWAANPWVWALGFRVAENLSYKAEAK